MKKLSEDQTREAHKIYIHLCEVFKGINNIDSNSQQDLEMAGFILGNLQGWVLANLLPDGTKKDDKIFKNVQKVIQVWSERVFLGHIIKNDTI